MYPDDYDYDSDNCHACGAECSTGWFMRHKDDCPVYRAEEAERKANETPWSHVDVDLATVGRDLGAEYTCNNCGTKKVLVSKSDKASGPDGWKPNGRVCYCPKC